MRERYLKVRGDLLKGNIDLYFLEEWCREEKRDFGVLYKLLSMPNGAVIMYYKMMKEDIIKDIVRYLDTKFSVTLVFKNNKLINVR